MRKLILGVLLGFIPNFVSAACTSNASPVGVTTRAGIIEPAINSCSWGEQLNANFAVIDASMCVQTAANTFSSTNTFSQPVLISNAQQLRFYDQSTHYIGLRSSNTSVTTNFVLPAADGTSGQAIITNGSGDLSFGNVSSSGGSSSGTVNSGSQYQTPYYSVSGSSNVLSATSNIRVFPSSVTILGAVPLVSTSTEQTSSTLFVSSASIDGNLIIGTNLHMGLGSSGGLNTYSTVYDDAGVAGSAASSWENSGRFIWSQPQGTTKMQLSASGGGNGANLTVSSITVTSVTVSGTAKFSGNVNISSGVLLSGAAGSNGQVLTSGGTGAIPTWTTVSGGGGGSSTLATSSGNATTSVIVSSPTSNVIFDSATFVLTLPGATTPFVQLNGSSVTLQGNNLSSTYLTNSSATATYLTQSSATLTYAKATGSTNYIQNNPGSVQTATITVSGGINTNTVYSLGAQKFLWDGAQSQSLFVGSITPNVLSGATNDTMVGAFSGATLTTGDDNTCVGSNSCAAITSGAQNTVVGKGAGVSLTTGTQNTAIGDIAMQTLTWGQSNTCVGYNCLDLLTSGSNNAALGQGAGADITTGIGNTCIGGGGSVQPCTGIITGSSNTMVGSQTGNVGVGEATNSANSYFGYSAGDGGNVVTKSICLGYNCRVTSSNTMVAGGFGTVDAVTVVMSTLTVSSSTIGVFITTLTHTVSGNINISSGVLLSGAAGSSGQFLTSGGAGTVPTWTTASGGGGGISGTINAANQNNVPFYSVSGSSNVLSGSPGITVTTLTVTAGSTVTTITATLITTTNTLVGGDSIGNAGFGQQTLSGNSGTNNTGFGFGNQSQSESGNNNSSFGNIALAAVSIGGNNSAFGYSALSSVTSGSSNTAVGFQAGVASTATTTGIANTFLGYKAGAGAATQLTNATAIGANSIVLASNTIQLGGTGNNGVTVNISSAIAIGGTLAISSAVTLGGSAGTNGQFLTSGGPGTSPTWTTSSGTGDVVKAATQTLTGADTFTSTVAISGQLFLSSNVVVNGSQGTSGQVLTSSGTGFPLYWSTASGGGPTLAATQTWTGQNTWTSPALSSYTYGVSVGSLAVVSSMSIAGFNLSGSNPIFTAGNNILLVQAQGRVGIGGVPNFTLDVTGTANASTAMQAPFFASANSLKPAISIAASGSNNGLIENRTSTAWDLGYGNSNTSLGTSVIQWDSSPAVNILSSMTVTGQIAISSNVIVNGSQGSSGQVLTSSGTGLPPYWSTVSGGSGSGIVSPGTFTWVNTSFGLSVSTINVSSVSTLSGPVNISSYTTITATGPLNAFKIVGNSVNGTTNGTSGSFLLDCTGGGAGSGMCGQVYSNAGAQTALDALWYLRANNTLWNEPLLYLSNAATTAQSTIRMDSGWPTLTMVDTTQTSPSGKFQSSAHLGNYRVAEFRNSSDNGFDSAIIVSSYQYSGDVAIGPGYNSATVAQLQVITSTFNTNILTLSTSSTGVNLLAVSTIPATAPTDYLMKISSTSGTAVFGVQNNGHVISSGTAPSVSACGTSPTMDGNSTDFAGTINTGSASPTACTLTFASPFTNIPVCIVSDDLQTAEPAVTSRSTTAITMTLGAALNSGHLFYICVGQKG